jgi:hypothetical protein
MWVQWQDLGDFAASLSRYPIAADRPALGEWGFGEQGQYTPITKVSIAPNGSSGGLVTEVSLADYYGPVNRCSTHFGTDYPSVDRFKDEIERMIRDRAGRAVLLGSTDVG